jgi:hypothetical protein
MKTIINVEHGYFPYKEATQNRALWLYGETNSGKTILASIITAFLIVCKVRYTNEKYMNTTGEGNIPTRAFFYNIFQLEEVTKGMKGPQDLMHLIDCGSSLVKHAESTEWDSDLNKSPHHFPTIITSNYHPSEIFVSPLESEQAFCAAALKRVIGIEFSRTQIPDLGQSNPFKVRQQLIARFIWAFVYHSPAFIDWGQIDDRSLAQYEEPDAIELTLDDLRLAPISPIDMKNIHLKPLQKNAINLLRLGEKSSNSRLQLLLSKSSPIIRPCSSSAFTQNPITTNNNCCKKTEKSINEDTLADHSSSSQIILTRLLKRFRSLMEPPVGHSKKEEIYYAFMPNTEGYRSLIETLSQLRLPHKRSWICNNFLHHDMTQGRNNCQRIWEPLFEFLICERIIPMEILQLSNNFECEISEATPTYIIV